MSAGPNAIPLWKENPDWKTGNLGPVTCQDCGWRGQHYELLVELDTEMTYCPQCKGTGWVWD